MKSLFVLPILISSLSLFTPKINNTSTTIINTEDSLGIFRDLTDEEVKDYYSSLANDDGIKGDQLLDELQTIISKDHTQISNSRAWDKNWTIFLLIDRNYEEDPLTQEEISSQEWKKDNVIVNPLYTDDRLWVKSDDRHFDREHMWPKSRGFKDKYDISETLTEQPYAATDMHNLRMGESRNNQSGHNNKPYGEVADKSSATQIVDAYSNQVTGYCGKNANGITVYEPRDEDKGDIARALFYMATRYHNYVDTETFQPSLKLVSTFESDSVATATLTCDSTKETSATYGMLDDLLKWHKEDPVDEFEIHRNNLVYNAVQGNRNPYVDYPEWAEVAFGEDVDYGINIDVEGGVEKEGLFVSYPSSDSLKINDTFKLDQLDINYIDSTNTEHKIQYNDSNLSISLTYNNSTSSIISDYTFKEDGTYTFNFNYKVDDTTTYSDSLEIIIAPLSEEEIFMNNLQQFIKDNWLIVLIVVAVVAILAVVITIIILRNKKAKKVVKKAVKKVIKKKKK